MVAFFTGNFIAFRMVNVGELNRAFSVRLIAFVINGDLFRERLMISSGQDSDHNNKSYYSAKNRWYKSLFEHGAFPP
jgi:hypothetical protein